MALNIQLCLLSHFAIPVVLRNEILLSISVIPDTLVFYKLRSQLRIPKDIENTRQPSKMELYANTFNN